jgi:hypothetical protein
MKILHKAGLLVCLLLCLASCREGGTSTSVSEVGHNKQQHHLPDQYVILEKSDSTTSCIHDYSPEAKGKIVIGPHDSLETLVANSSVEGEDLAALFEADEATYSSIGENIDVVFNTGFGVITLPKNLVVEFSYTDKEFVEERRDRSLAERYVKGATFRALPFYYRMNCLNPDIETVQKQILALNFKPVVLKKQKTLPEIATLFATPDDGGRLRQYQFAAWRQGDLGIYLSIVRAEMRLDLINEATHNKFLYNLVFDSVYIPEDYFWKEVQ